MSVQSSLQQDSANTLAAMITGLWCIAYAEPPVAEQTIDQCTVKSAARYCQYKCGKMTVLLYRGWAEWPD